MLERICGPVILYIGFCLVHILVDLYQKQPEQAAVKFFVMFIFSFPIGRLKCSFSHLSKFSSLIQIGWQK